MKNQTVSAITQTLGTDTKQISLLTFLYQPVSTFQPLLFFPPLLSLDPRPSNRSLPDNNKECMKTKVVNGKLSSLRLYIYIQQYPRVYQLIRNSLDLCLATC